DSVVLSLHMSPVTSSPPCAPALTTPPPLSLLLIPRPPRSTLFPYTALFRSVSVRIRRKGVIGRAADQVTILGPIGESIACARRGGDRDAGSAIDGSAAAGRPASRRGRGGGYDCDARRARRRGRVNRAPKR